MKIAKVGDMVPVGTAYNQTPKRTSSLVLTMNGGWQIPTLGTPPEKGST